MWFLLSNGHTLPGKDFPSPYTSSLAALCQLCATSALAPLTISFSLPNTGCSEAEYDSHVLKPSFLLHHIQRLHSQNYPCFSSPKQLLKI